MLVQKVRRRQHGNGWLFWYRQPRGAFLFLSLSGGEQRLVLLARVFVKDPDLIILDEPLHGLDVVLKKHVSCVIDEFCRRPGKTLVYVTHYPEELPGCVTRYYKLEKNI